MYTLTVSKPLKRPARRRELRRRRMESGLVIKRSQDMNPANPAAIKIFFGPNKDWRKPPKTATTMGA